MKILIFKVWLIFMVFLSAGACASGPANPMSGLDAVFWHQKSQEYGGVTGSLYYGSQDKLDKAIGDKNWTASVEQLKMGKPYPKKTAIVLDIDETVLNNSPLYARVVKDSTYNLGKGWSDWTAQGQAKALAGSVDFINYALGKGVTVFFVSNRSCTQDEATISNMKRVGFPVGNPKLRFISNNSKYGDPFSYDSCPEMETLVNDLLGVKKPKWASYKWARRSAIAKKYRILMLFGDSQGDLYSIPPGEKATEAEKKRLLLAHLTPEERDGIVKDYGSFFMDRWVQLPNSMYGNWLGSFNGYSNVTAMEDAAMLDSGYPTPEYAWVEMGPKGQKLARAIMKDDSCPDITVDGKTMTMAKRSGSAPGGFDEVLSCQFAIPSGAKKASVAGKPLALGLDNPKRILVIGDTGCRMNYGEYQNCNNVAGVDNPWPFKELSKGAAGQKPDLIIHVGDYYYREKPCPAGNKACAGPSGDNWATWEADFFKPASKLLSAAPWVFIRGNHETCARGWKGWFYFLDQGALPDAPWEQANCQTHTEPYAVDVGDYKLIVMDTADIPGAYSPTPDPATVELYAKQLDAVATMASKDNWLLTHRPIWAISSYMQGGKENLSTLSATLRSALKKSKAGKLADSSKMVMSGHLHIFEALNFTDDRPPQIIYGASGTMLDPSITDDLLDKNETLLSDLGIKRENLHSEDNFNYAVIEASEKGWNITLYELGGKSEAKIWVGKDGEYAYEDQKQGN